MNKGSDTTEALASAIEAQIEYLHRTRAMFPAISAEMAGKTQAATAPYYELLGFGVSFTFSRSLNAKDIEKANLIGHWINQNFCVRLYATLESHRVISEHVKIKRELAGAAELEILRRLRNEFAHGSGARDVSDAEHTKLCERIAAQFKLRSPLDPKSRLFPIPIDEVLVPMAKQCEVYGIAFLKAKLD